ncbi:hypothetical protein Tco_1539127 [Tanacetum coccineum]
MCQQCGVNLINGTCLNCTYGDGKPVTCCGCEGPLNGGFCSFCASGAGNSFAYDPNPNSVNDSQNFSDYPPHTQYQTETPKVLTQAWDKFFEVKYAQPEEVQELLSKLLQDLKSINEELAEYINSPSWNRPAFYFDDDDDEDDTTAITPDLPITDSLIMGDEHLRTISETESDELIKSSVENLVPIPSEFEDFSNNESECDVQVCDDFTTFSNPLFDSDNDFTSSDDESFSDEDVPNDNFKIYSNPLFDEEIISTTIDPHHFNAESDLIESLLNRDTLIKADFDLEKEIRFVENLSYDNSSPRPPEELNLEIADTILESLSPSHIPVADSGSLLEEIDLFLATDDSMLPGIENDDYDLEGDIRFLKELLSNDSPPLPENESSNLDHFNDPSSPRPPPEPPDIEICLNFKPDAAVINNFGELNEDECFDPEGGEINVSPNVKDDDYFPFTFVIRIFLPYLTYPDDSSFPLSSGSEDTIFDPGITNFHFSPLRADGISSGWIFHVL